MSNMSVFYLCYFGVDEPAVQSQAIVPIHKMREFGIFPILVVFDSLRTWWKRTKETVVSPIAIPILRLPRFPRDHFRINSILLWWAIRLRPEKIIIHARGIQAADVALWAKRRNPAQIKVICDFRGMEPEEYAYSCGERMAFFQRCHYRKLQRMMIRSIRESDLVFSVSQSLIPTLQGWGAKRVVFIPCCVDIRKYYSDQECPST